LRGRRRRCAGAGGGDAVEVVRDWKCGLAAVGEGDTDGLDAVGHDTEEVGHGSAVVFERDEDLACDGKGDVHAFAGRPGFAAGARYGRQNDQAYGVVGAPGNVGEVGSGLAGAAERRTGQDTMDLVGEVGRSVGGAALGQSIGAAPRPG
jgi:hypothetical protein